MKAVASAKRYAARHGRAVEIAHDKYRFAREPGSYHVADGPERSGGSAGVGHGFFLDTLFEIDKRAALCVKVLAWHQLHFEVLDEISYQFYVHKPGIRLRHSLRRAGAAGLCRRWHPSTCRLLL